MLGYRQCCAGLRVAEGVVTAHGVHLAFLHTPKQYGAVEQAMGRMVASATLGLKHARAIGATTVFEVADRDRRARPEVRNFSRAA